MTRETGKAFKILAAAAAVGMVAVSCPPPIDRELLLVVSDEYAPLIAFASPQQNSFYRFSVEVRGTLADSSRTEDDGEGFVRRLGFRVSGDATLDRTITFERDGSFAVEPPDPTFVFSPATGEFAFTVDTTRLDQWCFFSFEAEDLNGNLSPYSMLLMPDTHGPAVSVTMPTNGSSYSLQLGVAGTALNAAEAGSGDKIGYLRAKIADIEHVLDLSSLALQPDGKYYGLPPAEEFWFKPATGEFGDNFVLSTVSGDRQLAVEVKDVRDVATTTYVSLVDNTPGPEIKLNFDSTHICPTFYSSLVATNITMLGWVDPTNLNPNQVSYFVGARPQVLLVPGVDLDPATGELHFTFDPQQVPVLTGRLTVHVYAKDNAGRTSEESHIIDDDTANPGGSFAVAGGASCANSLAATLTFSISDGLSGMYQMRFSNDGAAWSGPYAYSGDPYAWTLQSGTDGLRTVHARFSDRAGNVLEKSDDITLDRSAPALSYFRIDDDATYTTDPNHAVTLDFKATDGSSGMHQMRLRNDLEAWGDWQAYAQANNLGWELADSDGTRVVSAQFKDNAGNVLDASDSIVLDRDVPVCTSLSINGGATQTYSQAVTLAIGASDAGGLAQMHFRNETGTWSGWETYATTKTWNLTADLGSKTVTVEVRDVAGRTSNTRSASIELAESPAP